VDGPTATFADYKFAGVECLRYGTVAHYSLTGSPKMPVNWNKGIRRRLM